MKKFFFSLIFLLTLSTALLAQINLSIKVSNQWIQKGDTINACKTSPLILTAEVSYANGDVFDDTNATFEWNFGDGTKTSGKGKKVVSHGFSSGAYYVNLTVTDNQQSTTTTTRPLRISNQPNLSESKSNKEEICRWDKFDLTGKVLKNTWEYKLENENILDAPSLITTAASCDSYLNFNFFEPNKTLENSDTLRSISVKMEHSNQGALEILLTCPNGTSIILKKNLGDNSFMGQPLISDVITTEGTGYYYTWSMSPQYSLTMDMMAGTKYYEYVDVDGNIQSQYYLPEGSYQPYESFSKLQGCPLNGEWKITINDTDNLKNNGYVFSWKLDFSDKVKTNLWKIENKYNSPDWKGEGISTLSPDGYVATAQKFQNLGEKEFALGNHIYTFSVKDDYGCKWDTTLTVKVTRANISSPKDSVTIDENKSFTFGTDTKWGAKYVWNFGDKSTDTTKSPSHTYLYGENPAKVYIVILKITSDNECSETDTVKVKVKALQSVLDFPNCLVIDGAVENQRFRYKKESVEKYNFLSFECKIFNRWGRLLYSWTDWKEGGWDGKINGRYVDEGIYYYSCEYLGTNKQTGSKRSFFYVVRKKQ